MSLAESIRDFLYFATAFQIVILRGFSMIPAGPVGDVLSMSYIPSNTNVLLMRARCPDDGEED
jgi:hypothetical protein